MPEISKLEYKVNSPRVPEPRVGSDEAAGFDLGLPHDVVIPPGKHIYVNLGIAFNVPKGHYLKIVPRSNTCDEKDIHGKPKFKHVIRLSNIVGVIDSDYTGYIGAKLYNDGSETYLGYQGDYILQAILQQYTKVRKFTKVDEISKQTERGDKGFGSSDE